MSDRSDGLAVVDGLIVSGWNRQLFEDMQRGGLTLANCTCSIWENFRDSMAWVAQCKTFFEDNSDLIVQVYSVRDVENARKSRRVGIVLGWQNTSGIEDQIPFLRLFSELGVRIMQLTYNTQNLVGSGCYERHDGGLSDFGKEVIDEMNRLRILIDLSHVGERTADDALKYSKQPVCYSHVAPAALKSHPRCKTDDQLRSIAKGGGFVGVTCFPSFLAQGSNATLDDYLGVVEYVMSVIGEERIGFGTDFAQNIKPVDYWSRDKGYARQLIEFGTVIFPAGLRTCADYPNLIPAMENRGWKPNRIERFMGENWLTFLRDVWGN
jgi:membrane dipeptidase